jgi:hypothetical protein
MLAAKPPAEPILALPLPLPVLGLGASLSESQATTARTIVSHRFIL